MSLAALYFRGIVAYLTTLGPAHLMPHDAPEVHPHRGMCQKVPPAVAEQDSTARVHTRRTYAYGAHFVRSPACG